MLSLFLVAIFIFLNDLYKIMMRIY